MQRLFLICLKNSWCVSYCVCVLALCPALAFAGAANLIQQGTQALNKKDFASAERAFTKAMQLEPKNYRAIQSLAQAKAELKKYAEAEKLATLILAMPIAKGRNVLVHLKGGSEPLEAEVVDENVIAAPQAELIETEFIKKPARQDPIPHYRLFFKKAGKIKLVPHETTRIEYMGVPGPVRQKMEILLRHVKKQIIASSNTGAREQEMVDIVGGCFMMGSNGEDMNEHPMHEVCVSPFKMDKYEITQRAFQAVMKTNPSQFVGADLPANRVNWVEADQYCQKIGKRLPTEAEWEYAARGGSTTEFYFGDKVISTGGNFCDSMCPNEESKSHDINDGFEFTAPVGSFPPNPFGLFDMAGNVSEWVKDWFRMEYYRFSPKQDPQGPIQLMYRVVRGGAFLNNSEYMRSARRAFLWPEFRSEGTGFRCASDR